eukprot:GDKJ01021290.1.p1 GENE.GDKJ01021290.1~~GDKJ01021290.1.p1  ORF type:complete len:685 (+),score=267.69 GDKJ01021290.1:150-2057(+)
MKNLFNIITGSTLYTDKMDCEQIWEQIDDQIVSKISALKQRVKELSNSSDFNLFVPAIERTTNKAQSSSQKSKSAWDSTDDEDSDSPVPAPVKQSKKSQSTGQSEADLLNSQARALGLADYDDASSDDEKFFADGGALTEKKKKLKGLKHKADEDAENALKIPEMGELDEEDGELDFDGEDDFEMSGEEGEGEEGEDGEGEEEDLDEDENDVDGEEDDDMMDAEEEGEEDEEEGEEVHIPLVDADEEEAQKEDARSSADLDKKKRAKALFDEPLSGNHHGSSFADLMLRDSKLDQEMDELERSLVGDKHWTMIGEARSRDRPQNSLLEQFLELPAYKKADLVEDAQLPDNLGGDLEAGTVDFGTKLTQAIEQLVIRRIKDLNFDDVERKAAVKVTRPEDEVEEEVLEFSKSKKSLAELYEDDFKRDVLGDTETELDKATQKAHEDISQLLAKLFFSMDAIANHRHLARPGKISAASKAIGSSMVVEEAVPVTMSTSRQKTPEEMHAVSKHDKTRDEMDHDEKRALRNADKRRRNAKLGGQLIEGEISLSGFKERKNKLEEKNKQAKADRKSVKETGLTNDEATKEKNRLQKKINTTDLLARASALNSFKVQSGIEKKTLQNLREKTGKNNKFSRK